MTNIDHIHCLILIITICLVKMQNPSLLPSDVDFSKKNMSKKPISPQGDIKMTDSESTPILIEFSPRPGVEAVAIFNTNPEEMRRKSEEALNNAMKNIEEMANRVSALQKKIPAEFSQVEVEFGIKFDWKIGALLAEAGTEASINVRLTLNRPKT